MPNDRRKMIKAAAAGALATAGVLKAQSRIAKKVHTLGPKPSATPLFSSAISYGNLLFLAGKVARTESGIQAQTKRVLDDIEKELANAGSSMDKVLKVTVYLSDIKDFAAMNEVYLGRFGEEPPVRTTVAVASLVGGALIEIDAIAGI
jgi:reactive intermediate/imine deaminase